MPEFASVSAGAQIKTYARPLRGGNGVETGLAGFGRLS